MNAINLSRDGTTRLTDLISMEHSLDIALEKSTCLSEKAIIKLIQTRQKIKMEPFDLILSDKLKIIRSYKKTTHKKGDIEA